MVDRTPLRKQLWATWRECIRTEYLSHVINSERGLQAVFYHRLMKHVSENRTVLVEPRFAIEVDGKPEVVVPDLLICNSRRIIGIVELKYQPLYRMSFGKDLQTLSLLSRSRRSVLMKNDRCLGPDDAFAKFELAEDALFVWAGVHYGPQDESANDISGRDDAAISIQELGDRFFQLHAVTINEEEPKVFSIPEIPGED
jgi:hypothetical protein